VEFFYTDGGAARVDMVMSASICRHVERSPVRDGPLQQGRAAARHFGRDDRRGDALRYARADNGIKSLNDARGKEHRLLLAVGRGSTM
jgi:hypothetical protein